MRTYQDNGYRYFYDNLICFWTIFQVDAQGNQVGDADYHPNKPTLRQNYPTIEFKILKEDSNGTSTTTIDR